MPDVLLRSEESDGVVSVVINTVPANWPGPFLHRHDFDEAFYVLVCTPAGFERYFARMNENPPEWALQDTGFEVERVGPQIGRS